MIRFQQFSEKQLQLLNWWCKGSDFQDRDAVICDGAVRSGKTLCMSISFIMWAFAQFDHASFAICAKTVTSLRRNVITPLMEVLRGLDFTCAERHSANYVEISSRKKQNRFYLFGGKDEGSAALIQGITLSGIMLDEVALMPRSFVEQALARCSVTGSKFWFNCNPEHPFHWFYQEWILKAEKKNALYLHFTMEDNPSLSQDIVKRYQSLYEGSFYERFVLGKWVSASGLVYPMFNFGVHVFSGENVYSQYYISCDYGTVNPTSMGLWGECGGIWYRIKEFYHDSRMQKVQKTDEEYYLCLEQLAGELAVAAVIVDPSAASFLECIRRHGRFRVVPAKNDVVSGIRRVGDALRSKKVMFHESCKDSLREFSLYVWEDGKTCDTPKKENDHAMDDIRYFVNTVLAVQDNGFFLIAARRPG